MLHVRVPYVLPQPLAQVQPGEQPPPAATPALPARWRALLSDWAVLLSAGAILLSSSCLAILEPCLPIWLKASIRPEVSAAAPPRPAVTEGIRALSRRPGHGWDRP